MLMTKHTVKYYTTFADTSYIHSGNVQPYLPMAADCKKVPRLILSFTYLNLTTYQTTRRQYVSGNPTYTYISLTTPNNKYIHS